MLGSNDVRANTQQRKAIVFPVLPTSWMALKSSDSTEFASSIIQAINGMQLDMLPAVARKDYEDKRRRQLEGIQRTRDEGKYICQRPDLERRKSVEALLLADRSYTDTQKTLNYSRHLIADVKEHGAIPS